MTADGERARLDEERLGALESRIDALLACGRHAETVAELEALTGAHPLRERLWQQRILALYRAGRQAEALRAFRELRQNLVNQLGLEPGPDLRALEAQILRHDPALGPPPHQPRATTTTSSRRRRATSRAAMCTSPTRSSATATATSCSSPD